MLNFLSTLHFTLLSTNCGIINDVLKVINNQRKVGFKL